MEIKTIVTELISDRLTELVNDFSSNEFRDKVGEIIFEKTGKKSHFTELNKYISDEVQPLLSLLSDYVKHSSFH